MRRRRVGRTPRSPFPCSTVVCFCTSSGAHAPMRTATAFVANSPWNSTWAQLTSRLRGYATRHRWKCVTTKRSTKAPPLIFGAALTPQTHQTSHTYVVGIGVEAHGLVVLEGYTQRSRHGDVTKARGQGPKVGNDLFRCPRYRGWHRAPRHV